MAPDELETVIRAATSADLTAVSDIYNHYVIHSTCTFQVETESKAERLAWFESHLSVHPVVVAESLGEVIGWAALSPWKSRCGYDHSVESSVYVRHDRHRQGIGRRLMLELIERARTAVFHTIIAGVCAEHMGSLALHESLGFERVAHFRQTGRKFGRWLDVIYLQYFL